MIEYTTFNSPIGKINIAAVKEGVVKISFSNESIEELDFWCQKHLGAGVREGSEYTIAAEQQILDYLDGKIQSLNFQIIHIIFQLFQTHFAGNFFLFYLVILIF